MFEMKTIGDYHDFHLKTDVLLLADVFEKFIGVYYKLIGTYFFVEKGMRGGISYIGKR